MAGETKKKSNMEIFKNTSKNGKRSMNFGILKNLKKNI